MEYQQNPDSRNIVLCSDGTGNRGGYTPDSNVFKLYNALDLRGTDPAQITFYDNGVGTSSNRMRRAITGAFGFGFGQNVRDLYAFLARNYRPGDRVFLFGFSRGAATIRAFSGFVHRCGLIDGRAMTDEEIEGETKRKFKQYRDSVPDAATGHGLHDPVEIEFIGVWDTVSALGFPRRTDITSIGLWLANWIFVKLDHLTERIPWLRHRFYEYGLTNNIKHACQALALDDARTAFWPEVWHERPGQTTDLHQVWFAGSHSNVGGGYKRSGMATVALDWMLDQACSVGLVVKPQHRTAAREDHNVHGKIFDSRDGLGVFYRFHPRRLSNELYLASENAGHDVDIMIHESVLERMYYRTANYAPLSLPDRFTVVDNQRNAIDQLDLSADVEWLDTRRLVDLFVGVRKWLYGCMMEVVVAFLAAATWFWISPPRAFSEAKAQLGLKALQDCPEAAAQIMASSCWQSLCCSPEQSQGLVVDLLNYLTPAMFENIITYVILIQPHWGLGLLLLFLAWLTLRHWLFRRTQVNAERLAMIVSDRFVPNR